MLSRKYLILTCEYQSHPAQQPPTSETASKNHHRAGYLTGQKVQQTREAGGDAEKVAYEEYGALIGGIVVAGAITAVFAPGLIILTVVGGVSALGGAEFGRWVGELLYERISAYETAMPSERKKQLLSDAALSVL